MSDIEDFTSDVMQRCEARAEIIKAKGTLGRPLYQAAIEHECAENLPVLHDSDIAVDSVPIVKELKPVPLTEKQKSISPPQSVGITFPLADHNIQMSASPVRRTRLRQLAQTINGWEDDYSHHNVPTSRFNLNKPSSPQRKPFTIPSSPQTKADDNNGVRHVVKPKTFAGLLNSTKPFVVSASEEVGIDKMKVVETADVENICKDIDLSHDSSFDVDEVDDYCSEEDEALKSSDLSDSFTFFTPALDNDNKSEENQAVDSKTGTSVTQKCILDDSVVHALEAQGFVHSPSKAKLSYQYQQDSNSKSKDNPSQQYQLPGPKKLEPPVKRAGSPVRQPPICSKTPSPVKNSPAVAADSGPRVIDSVRKQFEHGGKESVIEKPTSTAARLDASTSRISVAQKKAMFETKNAQPLREIDPTELSVSERKKLFERPKNLQPSAFASNTRQRSTSPSRPLDIKDSASRRAPRPSMIPAQPLKAKLKLFERGIKEEDSNSSDSDEEINAEKIYRVRNVPTKIKPDLVLFSTPSTPPPPPPLPGFNRSPSPQRFMPSNQIDHPVNDGFESSEEDNTLSNTPTSMHSPMTKKEVSFAALPKSPKTPKSPIKFKGPSPGKRSISPKANYPGSRDVKRIRVNDPKPGRIYPSLTDIETTEAETDTDIDNIVMDQDPGIRNLEDEEMDSETSIVSGSSLGTYIERQAIRNSPLRDEDRRRTFRPSEDFDASLCCRQVDECIDEALEGQDYSLETNICESSPIATSSPVKQSIPSPIQNLASQNLVHTVSFYRRQQTLKAASNSINLTPKRVIVPLVEEASPPEERTFSYEDQVNDLVKKLELEAQAQQRSMAEASKALNICKLSMEFSESTENVEFERVLLIATQKQSAIINEIHRLKTEGILGRKAFHSPSKSDFGPSCKGNLKLHEVAVHLKRDFMAQAMKGETIYHFIALVKYRNQLQASSSVCLGLTNNPSSHPPKQLHLGMLHFPNSFTIENLDPDFTVTVEIFVLETRKEFIPHEAKYHIKTDKGKMTPKKNKGDSKNRFTVFQQSPAGPNTILASKFQPVGSFTVDISTLQRSHWELENMRHNSYLEKTVSIKIQCSAEGGVEERGFLTMFQDISGYGDWHRRWCKLSPSELSFWMYPEDEPNEPLGKISLRACVTSRVGPVPRDVCARANTFLLITTREPRHGDKDSLVKSCHGDYTAVRHLISADTKEERDLWCKQFNRALANLRAWDPHAYAPDDTLF